jgi:hypothetical protein
MTSNLDDSWSDQDTEYLKQHWSNASAKTIAITLHRTRSAVIGKAHRLGLEKKRVKNYANNIPTKTHKPKAPRGRPPKPRNGMSVRTFEATEMTALPDEPIGSCLNISILELTKYTCHYPTESDKRGVATAYCGLPVASRAFCASHARLCYTANILPLRKAKRR